jgi:hydroxypyruvate reductase
LAEAPAADPIRRSPARVIAVGKAASAMAAGFVASGGDRVRSGVVIGVAGAAPVPPLEMIHASHPVPDQQSLAAGARALAIAEAAAPDECLVVLLSGGASSLLTAPAGGLSLDDLKATNRALLKSGADIYAINTVRKHLSRVKGGWLAARSRGHVRALVISDVVGDDLSVIGSGPTVADPSTFADADAIARRSGGTAGFPEAVLEHLARGYRGELDETPKPGDPRLAQSTTRVIGGRWTAMAGARRVAEALGYDVVVREDPVVGEARVAAIEHLAWTRARLGAGTRPMCVVSSGETTVVVKGHGTGGRNQEFALAAAEVLRPHDSVALASIGTDGIDGPTDAAGAIVDPTTATRAEQAGLEPPSRYLDQNNSYAFFNALGDLIRIGPTGTNVGDLQVLLVGRLCEPAA